MRLSDRSTFLGNPTQIVDQEIGDKNGPHINCIEQGFSTNRPRQNKSSLLPTKVDVVLIPKYVCNPNIPVLFSILTILECAEVFAIIVLKYFTKTSLELLAASIREITTRASSGNLLFEYNLR